MIFAVVKAALLTAADLLDDNPGLAEELVDKVLALLHLNARREPNVEAVRAQVAGLAAARANAVQAAQRRVKP